MCLAFDIIIVGIILFFVFIVLLFVFLKKLRYNRVVRSGKGIPASMLISQFTIPVSERGDVEQFTFPVRRPLKKEEIAEEQCPICFKDKKKLHSWVLFDCRHSVCNSCFQKMVARHRLQSRCPFCRAYLAHGEGQRGGSAGASTNENANTSTSTGGGAAVEVVVLGSGGGSGDGNVADNSNTNNGEEAAAANESNQSSSDERGDQSEQPHTATTTTTTPIANA